MSQQFDAIYENGILRPLVPLALPEQSRVRVIVDEHVSSLQDQSPEVFQQRLRAIATDCGVSLPDSALSREAIYQ